MSWKYVHTQFPSTLGQMNTIYSSLSHLHWLLVAYFIRRLVKESFYCLHVYMCVSCEHMSVYATTSSVCTAVSCLLTDLCHENEKKGRATKGKEDLFFFQFACAFLKIANRATWHKCLHAHMSFRHFLRVLETTRRFCLNWMDKDYLEGTDDTQTEGSCVSRLIFQSGSLFRLVLFRLI